MAQTAITPSYLVRSDYSVGVAALHSVQSLGEVGHDPVLLRLSDGAVSYFGRRTTGQARYDVSSVPPVGPFVQIAGSVDFGLGRRSDGTIVGWPSGTPGATTPAGVFMDISAWGAGAAGVRPTGQLRIWGSFIAPMPGNDPGPYVDVEVSPVSVVARRSDGTLVQFGLDTGAPEPPAESFVEHKMGGSSSLVLGIGRRSDATLAVWGKIGAPQSFLVRPSSRVVVGGSSFGSIAATDGSAWIAAGTAERRFEGPYLDIAPSRRSFIGLRPDGSIERVIAGEVGVGASNQDLLSGGPEIRLPVSAYPKRVAIVLAGNARRAATFAHCEDGTVRILEGSPWPQMTVGADGSIMRDVTHVWPILTYVGTGGALVLRQRDGSLHAYAAWPQTIGADAAVPYRVPSGVFREFVGEAATGTQRHLYAIDGSDQLVRWDPSAPTPNVEVVVPFCALASGQGASAGGTAQVIALDGNGQWQCFGAGDAALCAVPSSVVAAVQLVGRAGLTPEAGHGFGLTSERGIVHWGATGLASSAPSGPIRDFGVTALGTAINGAAILADGAFSAFGFNPILSNPYTLNDPSFSANDIVQTMSQCTVRVGAGDCDADGVLDWDEIVSAGAAGDCNDNGIPDSCDIAAGEPDADGDGVPDACARAAVGDLNGDGRVNGPDIAILLSAWGGGKPGAADLNGDGSVNGADLALLLSNWTD
jgi:hypothetical protein